MLDVENFTKKLLAKFSILFYEKPEILKYLLKPVSKYGDGR